MKTHKHNRKSPSPKGGAFVSMEEGTGEKR